MLHRLRFLFFISTIGLFAACQQEHVKQIPISDFFKSPEKTFFGLSPDGKYVSFLKPYKGRQNLFIQSLADGKEQVATSFEDYSVRNYSWTYNNRIVLIQDVISIDEYKMYALDVPELKLRDIMALDKGRINILSNRTKGEPDVVTISMNKRDPANFDIYKLNVKTGELKPYLINPGNITEWFPDDDGKIRLGKSSDGVDETILYRANDNAPFKTIIKNNFINRGQPIAFSGVKSNFYALSNVGRDKSALVEIDAETGKEQRVVFACGKADINRVDYSRDQHHLEFASCEEEKSKKNFLNDHIAHIFDTMSRQLHNTQLDITSRDSAENKFIFFSYTDRNPGTYYLYERSSGKITSLGNINSKIKPEELCAMQPISFTSRDGLTINGYLTLPQGGK